MQKGYLFISTETESIFQNNKTNYRLFYIEYALIDYDGNEITKQFRLLKPNGFKLSRSTELIFKIDQLYALEYGENPFQVLSDFEKLVQDSSLVIGYDLGDSLRVLEKENHLNGIESSLPRIPKEYLDSSHIEHYCSPEFGLDGLHYYLFGEHLNISSLDRSIKCFFELKRRKVI